jgi:hypothetical protein
MDEISASDLRDIITREDDFGHEMRVGSVLRSCSAAVIQHGGTYTDSISDKPRQFDYRCWVSARSSRLALAIECKNIDPTSPLVVCGTSRHGDEAFHDLIESRQGRFDDGGIIHVGLSSVTRRVITNNMFYPRDEFVGKALLRAQMDRQTASRSGESEIYDRWAQALSSAVELGTSATLLAKHLSVTSVFSAVLPMVVVPNGMLWRAIYDNHGALISEPTEVDECAFFVGREIVVAGPKGKPWFQKFTFSHVHFLTVDGLKSFLSKMVSDTAAWGSLFVDVAEAVRVSAAYPRDPSNA